MDGKLPILLKQTLGPDIRTVFLSLSGGKLVNYFHLNILCGKLVNYFHLNILCIYKVDE
jgi:hypothetical protein